MEPIELLVCVAGALTDIAVPEYKTTGAAGFDLQANIRQRIMLPAREWRLISTGLTVAIPEGFEGQVRPRSGLALKHGISILNAPGTIDSDYRGDVGVILMNNGNLPFQISPGDRIAQMVIAPVNRLPIRMVSSVFDLGNTERGAGGYGSTGQ